MTLPPAWVRTSLLALVGALVLAAALLAVPGYLTVDEGTYHLMASAAARGELTIHNGYEDVHSLAMGIFVGEAGPIRPHAGRLVAQYPPLWSSLTLPLYLVEGYRALFHTNALALGVLLLVIYRLGRALWDDPRVALVGAAIFGLSTYALDYATAAWPHLTHVAFTTSALLLALLGVRSQGRRGLCWAGAAGLVLGLDFGVRLDGVFVAPFLLILQLFQPRARVRQSAATLLGFLPGLGLLSAANHAKFGSWNPFFYGNSFDTGLVLRFLPGLVGLGLLVLARQALLSPASRAWLVARRGWLPWTLLCTALLMGTLVAIWAPARVLARGLLILLVDFRAWSPDNPPIGWAPDLGAVRFIGGYKKALLQSCPWLPLALVPLVRWVRRREGGLDLPILALVSAAFVLAYSIHAWHGGLCLNLRYLLPALPLAALLAAHALLDLWPRERVGPWLGLAGVVAAGLLFLPTLLHPDPAGDLTVIMGTPLRLALLLAGLLALGTWSPAARIPWLRGATTAAAMAALAWGAFVGIGYDARLNHAWRSLTLTQQEHVTETLPAHALVLVDYHYPLYGLIDAGQVRMANILTENVTDLPAVVAWHRAHGWAVYGMLQDKNWTALLDSGVLGPARTGTLTDIGSGARLGELTW